MPALTSGAGVLIATAILGYLLGSIPFGIVITRAFGLGDLRQIGSGNIGATNVLRTGNKLAAFLTLILDSGKGAIAVLIAMALAGQDAVQVAGFAAFLGHCFPVWLKFKGGKGVATYLGTLLALFFPGGLAACGTWLVMALIFRISSLSALIAAAVMPLWLWAFGRADMTLLAIALAVLIFIRHKANIARLLKGEEPKIGKKKG
ncbi:glycerol-3-phosphate 1-O-acyltransferase PlsY [Pseudooceanicola sp. CBS1P-1]|uniref:Glycerol-3-phosphate acyltransferase n=1 Tax=Pseudooceanicola albus TaxID=2692189 RepID=A0A6L7G1C1_9RHOB|nr:MULTISPECIES: glycerol-3-phosphate 1-O-acyltransferase PlsY [Pseudooceanicola]MBT9384862.1 glycerol-3-phosphate 1-O-acyltransferase PlsY [Pseudooceanicola endophyticus]MXN18144.1 glycerol-3-phosphate 1-O-acyltransferase PlsY [Pseudooceanicola albus]